MNELCEKFGKDKVHFIKCDVLNKDDIVNLYEVLLLLQNFKKCHDIDFYFKCSFLFFLLKSQSTSLVYLLLSFSVWCSVQETRQKRELHK